MELSREHYEAVERRRRVVVQFDAFSELGGDFAQWIDYRFRYADEAASQIDSLWWDIGGGSWATYPSAVMPRLEHPGLCVWWEQGIDWVRELIEGTRQRGLEVFWNHRVSEVDLSPEGGLEMERLSPMKAAHPDWVVRTWWWQGLWNLASPGAREYKLSILEELARQYDLDGFQLDFARHVPCLPVGRQWELRGEATEFVRMVREMLLGVARERGRPLLLAARVPQTPEGCAVDGLDVGEWARQDLVDILTLGTRSMDVDVAGFRELAAGHHIKLQPCLDDHHATDGYRCPPIEHFRGVFGNWWQQGADSVLTFNWSNAPAEACAGVGAAPGPESQRIAYHEVGSPATLAGKNKCFAVERRGGYPWAEGFFNRNDGAALPAMLPNDGRPVEVGVRLCEDAMGAEVRLRVVLFGALAGDEVAVRLGETELELVLRDEGWKDPQIKSPAPQPASGGPGTDLVDPAQELVRLEFVVPGEACRVGVNPVRLGIRQRGAYLPGQDLVVEKVEVWVGW